MNNVKEIMQQERICVVIPSYKNEGTIVDVIRRIQPFTDNIIVVLDGNPSVTRKVIEDAHLQVIIVAYERNRGKGDALKEGFKKAILMGFEYAITIDSDGQHYPEDIPLFIEAFLKHRGAFLVGVRDFGEENMPGKNNFANKFSNFWFYFQTGISLPDTQCGYRMYPLSMLDANWHVTSRYESELEFLVYSAWKGKKLVTVPIQVFYPEEGKRISSFRPFWDFLRITILNIVLTTGAVFYYQPARLIRKRGHRQ